MELTVKMVPLWYIISCLIGSAYGKSSLGRVEMYNLLFAEKYYDKSIPPNIESRKPTEVQVDLYVHSFDAIRESSMDFTVNMLLFLEWTDTRLKWKFNLNSTYLELDVAAIGRAWLPDVFFPNEKEAYVHEITSPNKMLRIYENGNIFYATRVSLTLGCPMNLKKYPLDAQSCPIQVQSFGYSESKVTLVWSNTTGSNSLYNDKMKLPQFEVKRGVRDYCNKKFHPRSDDHTCLEARFILERNLGYYLVQIYVPSVLIVMLSWVSFWLNVDSVPARISLGVLTVLTMTTQTSAAGATLPRVSYTKAIDIWMSTCLIFVFSALIEFAVANVLARAYHRPSPFSPEAPSNETAGYSRGFTRDQRHEMRPIVNQDGMTKLSFTHKWFQGFGVNGQRYARNLDLLSRIFFPLVFGVFNLLYWVSYIHVIT
ncbi:glycine receptor subunit alphaZ1-like [Liolophura sinensis]|uniref:glycine receptor subunit alphaZ1-like n=1 Tax=Liolophura sinensis TaxID=3198878 RepID=UPI00315970B0